MVPGSRLGLLILEVLSTLIDFKSIICFLLENSIFLFINLRICYISLPFIKDKISPDVEAAGVVGATHIGATGATYCH